MREIPERVQEKPTIVAYVKGEEVSLAIMPWSTSRGK
jgi:hypothetical protein